jgi:hypothetical protein
LELPRHVSGNRRRIITHLPCRRRPSQVAILHLRFATSPARLSVNIENVERRGGQQPLRDKLRPPRIADFLLGKPGVPNIAQLYASPELPPASRSRRKIALLTLSLQNIDQSFETPRTPPSESDDDHTHHAAHAGAEDDSLPASAAPKRKPGGYDSRIEQILYENPDMSIMITDAGKSLESGGRYIVYTIRTGVGLRPLLETIPDLC